MKESTKKRSRPIWATADRPSVNLEGKPYLNLQEAAHFLSLSPWTLRQLIRKGEITSARVGMRIIFDREDLIRFIEDRKHRLSLGPYPSIQKRGPQ